MKFPMLKTALLLAAISLFLTACNDEGNSSSSDAKVENPVAFVNGKAIGQSELDEFVQMRSTTQPGAALDEDAALQELVSLEALRQKAEAEGIQNRDDVKENLERQRTNLLINTLLSEQMDSFKPSEEEMKAKYEEQMGKMNNTEYKARHILVDAEDKAKELIVELDGGADFAALAKEHSTGPSGANGGDLGWFNSKTMVEPFADAVQEMEKGQYSKEPVQTQFGWHVILLEDTRKMEVPPYDAVKAQVAEIMQQEALKNYIDGVREGATIEITKK